MGSFYSEFELTALGLKQYGKNVKISRKASIYNPEKMIIGDNVRIDDFCILSGTIFLNSFIHISAYTAMYGRYGIIMESYSGISPRCTIFSATDDFSGEYMIGPMINDKYTNVNGGQVRIQKHVQIGANSVILPNISINEGVAIGALSLVNEDLEPWWVYAGIPVKKIKERKKDLLKLEEQFISELNNTY